MMLRTGSNKGFTLIEVMVATAVLSLGVVFISETLFRSLDAFHYCYNYLNLAAQMDEKIWQAQEGLTRLGQIPPEGESALSLGKQKFPFQLSYALLNAEESLYRIDLLVSWQEGARRIRLSRAAYAIYQPK